MNEKYLTQDEFAELVTWAMCRLAGGGGKGMCDPTHCVCGAEGKAVADSLYSKGYTLVSKENELTIVAKAGRVFGVFVALALYLTVLYFIIRLTHKLIFG